MSNLPAGNNTITDPQSAPMVRLVDWTRSSYNLSIASARTCYSGKGIVYPEDVDRDEGTRNLRDKIASSTLKAGHLTTRQHPQFIFALDRVSRHLVWSFLHFHEYYNSEQVSQRYVAVKDENYYIPPSLHTPGREKLLGIYLKTIQEATQAYFRLTEMLMKPAGSEYFSLFPAREKQRSKWDSTVKKKAMEAARYVLPVATYTRLYHTVNGLTMHRYVRMKNWFDLPGEVASLIDAMAEEVRKADPLFFAEFLDPLPVEETLEFRILEMLGEKTPRDAIDGFNLSGRNSDALTFIREFDESLNGGLSRLESDGGADPVVMLGQSLRSIFGISRERMSDEQALRLLLDPSVNRHLSSGPGESSLSRASRPLTQIAFTFRKKLSHTADSQDQRHRKTPGARPILMRQFTGHPDFITPALIASDGECNDDYNRVMDSIFSGIVNFLESGGTEEEAAYLLPNAFPVRFFESGNLLDFHHKWKFRLCYNAQEEIFNASMDEVRQIEEAYPGLAGYFRAPCDLRFRAGINPPCPEGDRYCGVQVWKRPLSDYERLI